MNQPINLWGTPAPRFTGGATMGSTGYLSPYIQSVGVNSTPLVRADSFGSEFQPSFMQGMLGYKDAQGIQTNGWGMPALGAAQGLANVWMGMKQYGLGKKRLAEDKRQFGLNFDAQMRTTNAALEDRQRARVASNPGAYQSVGDYMNKNAIKGG